MLSLFIDESGQFENAMDNPHAVVGGIMIRHKDEAELAEAKESLQVLFTESYGAQYRGKLHGHDRQHHSQQTFIDALSRSRRYVPLWIRNGQLSIPIHSNIADDRSASLLYFNMLNQLLSGLLFFNPDILAEENTVHIYLASRVAVRNARWDKRREGSFDELGITGRTGYLGDTVYHLNNETSLLIHLNRDARTIGLSGESLHVQIKKVKVDYEENSWPWMDFFYAADIVCNHVYNGSRNRSALQLRHYTEFVYDDIHEQVRSVADAYRNDRHAEFVTELARYRVQFQKHPYRRQYDSYCDRMEVLLKSRLSKADWAELVHRLSLVMSRGQYHRQEGLICLAFFQDSLEKLSLIDRVTYHDLQLQTYNHLGAYERGLAAYNEAMEKAEQVQSIDMVERKKDMTVRLATTYANAFDFTSAMRTIEQAVEIQNLLLDTYASINVVLFNGSAISASDSDLAKMHSSKGQFLAFTGNPEAYGEFIQAIRMLKNDPGNRAITLSYFVHFLCDHTDYRLTDEDRALVQEYLGETPLEERIKAFEDRLDELRVDESFLLYAMIKWIHYRGSANMPQLIALGRQVTKIPAHRLQHPWELISMNLAMMTARGDTRLSSALFVKAKEICSLRDNDLTMRLLGSMINLRQYQDQGSVTSFIRLVESCQLQSVADYFEIDRLGGLPSHEDRVRFILEKFRFTRH